MSIPTESMTGLTTWSATSGCNRFSSEIVAGVL
jgi:heat shock protein HslJ